MSLREEFVHLAGGEDANIAELCRRFSISRKTGYKWIHRFGQGDRGQLADQSRRPRRSPRRSSGAVEQAVIEVRQQHPAWGGRKIHQVLKGRPDVPRPPAPSTIGQILLRHGLIDPDESQKHRPLERFEHPRPNDLWQMDFKGHVAMEDGGRCHPLTVLDDHSRFCVGLQACADEQTQTVRPILVELFERYGQPWRILCDNGGPWGSCSGGGDRVERYTLLEVWLLRHGVAVSHGRPYHPQTQGKEERFHRTLKAELLSGRSLRNLNDARERFEPWRQMYN